MNTLTKIKHTTQKGFTFVELLIIMIVVAILSGIGIQFVLSTQEDKAKLTNAKSFLAKDIPTAIYSCILRRDDITTCDATALIAEDVDSQTEWGDIWTAFGSTDTAGLESVTLCYNLTSAGAIKADAVGAALADYLTAETSWDTNGSTYSYLNDDPGEGSFTLCGEDQDQFVFRYVTRN